MSIFLRFASIAIFLIPLAARSAALDSTFFAQETAALQAEYSSCTGDSTPLTRSQLVAWRKRLRERTQTAEYQKTFHEYVIAHEGMLANLSPCEVMAWDRARQQRLLDEEKELTQKVNHRADRAVDTMQIRRELSRHPASPFDLGDIPFGLSRKVFRVFLRKFTPEQSIDSGNIIQVPRLTIAGLQCAARFYFDESDRYWGYALLTPKETARNLNSVVRPRARTLADYFERRLGSPGHTYRVGYFDIVPQRVSPLSLWRHDQYRAAVGLGAADGRYFAIARVSKKLNTE